MRVVTLLVAGALSFTGCTRVLDIAGKEWTKPNASIQEVTYDEVECVRESEDKGDLPDTIVGGIVDAIVVPMEDRLRGAAYDRCMRARGYEKVAATAR